jgi:hypothetical protein
LKRRVRQQGRPTVVEEGFGVRVRFGAVRRVTMRSHVDTYVGPYFYQFNDIPSFKAEVTLSISQRT